jgi:ferredoxin--NADP+ reductase
MPESPCGARADILDTLDRVFSHMIGSSDQWARRKAELKAGGRWVELVY